MLGMQDSLQQILEQQLRDVHAPEAIGWWPLAIGWWLVIAALLSITAILIVTLIRHFKKNRYRKLAAVELIKTFQQWQQYADSAAYLQQANSILKRSVIHGATDESAISLSGQAWLDCLNLYSRQALSTETEHALGQQCYQALTVVDIESVHGELLGWLKTHKAPKQLLVPNTSAEEVQRA